MKRYLVFMSVVLFFITSCTLKAVYNKKTFMINPEVNYTSNIKTNRILRVETGVCDARFDSTLFYYKKNSYEFEPYATVGWVEPLCYMLKNDVAKAIRKSNMFGFVQQNDSLSSYDYKLSFSIVDLEPVFDKSGDYILCNIRFSLFDNKNVFISSHLFHKKIRIKNIHPQNIVKQMNITIEKALTDMLKWLNKKV